MTDVPHFAFPFTRDPATGHAAEVEQDSIEDVTGCVQVVLITPRGWRVELPEFGTPDPTFSTPPAADIEVMRKAVSDWEPRAFLTVTDNSNAFELGVQRLRMIVERNLPNG